ncbi:MAG: glycosyltransferase family 4 protein [Jatrophihabitantaceae bacterium]
MRIVLVHRYFWPDTPPYAHILRELAQHLGAAGHQVTVLSCQPSYNRAVVAKAPARECLAPGVEVRRWPILPDRRFAAAKALNLLWFCLRLLLARRGLGRVDVLMAASTPPIAVAKLGGWLARRSGARFVYHKQDIYPEVVTAPGILRDGRWAALLRALDARTERGADRVVVLSEDMAATVAARGVAPDRITVINNFDPWLLDERAEPPRSTDRPSGPLHVVFAGNLGRFQNLENVFEAATLLRGEDGVAWHFFGTGALAAQLEEQVCSRGLRNVQLHGYRPPAEVAEFLRTRADVGIVSLMPGVIRAAYPSKTMSYLRQGCPVLALVEADSELARDIEAAGSGLQVDPTDPGALASTLRRLAANPAELSGAGRRAAQLYERRFGPAGQLARWTQLFDELGERRPT